ncbi:GerMN domain-containing protein [Caldalkalibacillus mannanilyticus]|uniref:GerMN domain-containing protein n=1 Tax=Caldalkalibacillus mannanilyticus TaxID=1418 RepID=UPI0004688DFE|nr:GerMN domain-containing protein [Caldalkalibacillus mannanilyticus]
MRKSKVILGVITLLVFTIVATGCVFGPKEDASIEVDPPQIDYTEGEEGEFVIEIDDTDGEVEVTTEGEATKEVNRQLYLFDHEGRVTPITVKLPHTESVAKQALEYLVADGPVTELLPDGMRAVLPAGTDVAVTVKPDGTAIVDFSNEFKNYQAQDEKGILEAITWTLTQFDTIKQVVIWINGHEQEVMPVDGTPIGQSLSRKDGINVEVADGVRVGNNSVITIYFKAQNPSATHDYYVPISRLVPKNQDLVQATVKELIAGPMLHSGLFSEVRSSTKVDVSVTGRTATLNFDDQFLNHSMNGDKASDDALHSLVLSLTETGLVDQVQFMVNGESNLMSFLGTDLTKPVSRPVSVNPSGF